jgi:Tol biopolymer transport system component
VTIESGQQLLHYRLIEQIGEGGMGVVWKAVDTTLDREVAIKILPDSFVEDPERVARFAREAKLLASLNHPNVASIFGIHEAPQATHFLAMELIEGEDLQQRTTRGALPIEEALRIALEIAQGFEAAHARGIIHRDLKPANVKLTQDGGVKVLDFGLAKALTQDASTPDGTPSMSPTLTSTGTVAGTILGTASYMSPEQAKGKPVDRRADIWSFGVVLFELVSGRRLFEGESISETLAAVLMKDPDWSALPSNTPARVRRLLQRCLTRNPKNRLQDIGDARIYLQEVLAGDDEAVEVDAIGSAPSWSRRALPWLGPGLLLGLAVGWGVVSLRDKPRANAEAGPIMRFAIQAAQSVDVISNLAASPDDRYVVYEGVEGPVNRLYLHDFDSGSARPLAGTEGAESPFLSPDGRWVAFHRRTDLMKVRPAGGDAVKICDVPPDYPGATWGPDGTILFPRGWIEGLWRVSADGGEPVQLTTVDVDAGEKGHWWPKFLPDGRHALFTIWNAGAGLIDAEIAVLDVQTGEYRKVIRGADARFLPPGHLVYYHAGSYHAIAFDLDTLEVTGDPMPVLDDVRDPLPEGTEDLGLAISGRGTVFYNTQQVIPPARLAIVKPDTEPRPLAFSARSFRHVAVSPDRTTIAAASIEAGVWAIRLLDLRSGTDERIDLTGSNWRPLWKPDGSGFAFTSMRKGDFDIYFKDVRGGGAAQPIRVTLTDDFSSAWSADGAALLATVTHDGGYSLQAVPVGGSADESTVIADFDNEAVDVSPDGEWLAYSARRDSGLSSVYVRPYSGEGADVRVSPGIGREPAWSPDGTELYYVRGDNSIVSISFTVEEGRFRPGREEVLFQSRLMTHSGTLLAVFDRRTFVVRLLEAEPEPPHLNVVLNWSREVAARLAEQ